MSIFITFHVPFEIVTVYAQRIVLHFLIITDFCDLNASYMHHYARSFDSITLTAGLFLLVNVLFVVCSANKMFLPRPTCETTLYPLTRL